jgi:succinate dehydrogenase / fumarate reductase flavoprotein subunit
VHGANRLGGNSLAETVAIGALVGDHVATQVTGDDRNGALPDGQRAIAEREFQSLRELEASDGDETPEQLLADLGDLLWEHAGILRTDESVSAGLEKLRNLRERTGNMHVDGDRTSLSFELAVDLSFSLTVAEALLLGARKRDESRGAHYRTDAPDVDPDWRRNILVDQGDTGLELTTRGVAEPSDAVSEAVDVGYELDYHHLE